MLEVLRFWLDLGLDGFRLDAVPYLFEEEGTNCENLPRTHEYLKRVRKEVDENYADRVLLAEANQWPEDVVAYFGDGRRVPHGLPLPRHAADVHVAAARGGAADDRDPRPHAGDPGERAVGPLPAQPRRADARDGHRRGARLHVRRVREGPADEAQRRHPPPARAAARRRPRRDRADARDPVLAAGLARALLRGRDRDGRQRLPRRPRRRAHADAVDGRPERRLLARGLRPALPAAADGSRLRLPGGQRRGAAAHADLAAALAAPLRRAAQAAPRLRARRLPRAAAREPEDLRPHPLVLGGHRPLRPQPRADGAGGRARPLGLRRAGCRSSCFGNTAFPRIGELPYLLTLGPRGFFWFQLQDPADDD